ncbi:hypothetical protein CP8484711_2132A, partial [Chlamydia psittaci 84-8471/1]
MHKKKATHPKAKW